MLYIIKEAMDCKGGLIIPTRKILTWKLFVNNTETKLGMLLVRSDGYHSNARYANDKTDLAPMTKDHGEQDLTGRPIWNQSWNQIQNGPKIGTCESLRTSYAPRPTDHQRVLYPNICYRMFAEKYSTGQEESWKLCVLEQRSLHLRIRWVYKNCFGST